jgi:AraC-like DNA-binding protein
MLLSLTILGICLSAILLYFHRKDYGSSSYLGFFFLLLSIYGFNQYILFYSDSVLLIAIIFMNPAFLYYLIGPLFYWYFRSVLTDQHQLKKKDLWHFLPAIIFFAASLPYVFTPWSEKLHVATLIHNDPDFMGTFNATKLHELFTPFVIFMSRPVQSMVYVLFSFVVFFRYLRKNKESVVLLRQQFMTKWLIILLSFFFILVTCHILLMFESYSQNDMQIFTALNMLQVLSYSGMFGLLISPLFFPGILYGLPRLPQAYFIPVKNGEIQGKVSEETHRNHPHFESEYLRTIGQKADSCMRDFSPYLQPDFSLAKLSVLIGVPVHHLAFYFREELRQSFSDFRNKWRIDHAKDMIINGKANDLTLESIGILSGFTNRNTFLTAFKKFEGISPQAFVIQGKISNQHS